MDNERHAIEGRQTLKPCPFCGGEDLYVDVNAGLGDDYYSIACEGCGAGGPMSQNGKSCAVDQWNRRHNE